jgi:hypothetical protein
MFVHVVKGDRETTVVYQYQQKAGWESRLIAKGAGEEVAPSRLGQASGIGATWSASATFDADAVARIKALHLQRRPYHWVEFRNVSLEPGHKTTVEVKDFDGMNQAAQN